MFIIILYLLIQSLLNLSKKLKQSILETIFISQTFAEKQTAVFSRTGSKARNERNFRHTRNTCIDKILKGRLVGCVFKVHIFLKN